MKRIGFIFLLLTACHGGSDIPPDPILSNSVIPCIDTLGAAEYPHLLKEIPLNYGIGGFAHTFGDFYPIAVEELQRGRVHVRINILWSLNHTYKESDLHNLKLEAMRYDSLCALYPNKIELAPFTEHNISHPDKYLIAAAHAAPHCAIVNSVLRGGVTWNPSFKNEVHGEALKPDAPEVVKYNYSYDGEDAFESNVKERMEKHSGASMFCVWTPSLNGKKSVDDNTPIAERTMWPDDEMIKTLVNLLK